MQFAVWIFLGCLLLPCIYADSPTDYFSDHDSRVVRTMALATQAPDGTFASVKTAHFAVATLRLLNSDVPQKDKVCMFAKGHLNDAADVATLRHSIHILEALGCGEKVGSGVLHKLEAGLESESLPELYEALSALAELKRHNHVDFSDDVSAVAKMIHDLLEVDGTFTSGNNDEEGSALNTGLAYHALALLKKHFSVSAEAQNHINSVVQTVDDFFSTARDDDGMLEFTDLNPLVNLKATSLVWTGANALAATMGGIEIKQHQVVGLAEYFVKNKFVTNIEDGFYLLAALKTISSNSFKHSPLVLTLPRSSILSSSKGDEGVIKVAVTDIFGHFATSVGVYIVKVFPVDQEKQIILRNQKALPVSDGPQNIAYSFNFLATKPDQGFYSMEFSVSPSDKASPYFPIEETTRTVKVVAAVELADVALQIADAEEHDDSLASNPISLHYPHKLAEVLRANAFQTIAFSFRVHASGRPLAVNQAFLRFTNMETQREAVFVAEQQGKKYKFSLNIKEHLEAFNGASGKYVMTLIVGDSLVQNPISWELATLNIHFGKFQREAGPEASNGPLPEITHQFRAPDKRPLPQVSLVFTALVLSPFVLFLVGLSLVGANISNFPFANPKAFFFATGFQGCIGAILGLFVIYWLHLTMVQTLGYLLVLSLGTIIFGQRALRYVASLHSPHKKTH